MLRAFGHRVAMCCSMLGVVGSSLKLVKFGCNNTQHVATWWPNARNMLRPTMLRSFGRGFTFHSTETALQSVTNDIMLSLDRGENVSLLLLDLSAAFDIVNHSLLLLRLERAFGFTGFVMSFEGFI